ncbi:MAG TPA: peptide deformylase [Vicinamibacteria bacterium]|nr:peptide deformylase [Vicinamibacteria bacterium]
MILKVARLGHPAIRATAREVPAEKVSSPELQRLLDDMVETMHEYDGVGLAGPQVHVGLRVAVLEVPGSDQRAREPVPLMAIVNPRLAPIGDEMVPGWEGCLSVPDLRGVVPRHRRVRLRALDRQGQAIDLEAQGFFARVLQHECDHLDGGVYLDRMDDLRSLSFLRELARFHEPTRDDDHEA